MTTEITGIDIWIGELIAKATTMIKEIPLEVRVMKKARVEDIITELERWLSLKSVFLAVR